jgi:membrane-bound inhibitor of C-type lysozyme
MRRQIDIPRRITTGKTPLFAVGIIVLILIIDGFVYFVAASKASAPTMAEQTPSAVATSTTATSTVATNYPPPQNQNIVTYFCDEGSIKADFIDSTLPSSRISITMPSGKTLVLPQVQSGSGIRYETGANTSSDVQFDSEGANAFLSENGTNTLNNCLAGTSSNLENGLYMFTDQSSTFSFSYPPSLFTISGQGIGYSTGWMQNTTALGTVLAEATLPGSFEPKTNFVDAVFTIGTSADPTAVSECLSDSSGGKSVKGTSVTINGVRYTKFVSTGVGAGNIYQTTSYRTLKDGQCYAIEYTIHSANLANYSPSQGISAFNQTKVQTLLEELVQNFTFL